jgi:hypothetical protein
MHHKTLVTASNYTIWTAVRLLERALKAVTSNKHVASRKQVLEYKHFPVTMAHNLDWAEVVKRRPELLHKGC